MLFVVCCVFLVVGRSLFVVCCVLLLSVRCVLLLVVRCMLLVVCCVPFVDPSSLLVRCSLFRCCSLFVVR